MDAAEAAVALARAYGLRVDDPVVLRDGLNVLVHLRPTPVVARVPALIGRVRPGDEWLRREVEVGEALNAAGAPVVPPSPELPPGPHHHEGHVVSFWTYIDVREQPADPAAAGAALKEVHEALRGSRLSLPVLGTITEAEAMLMRMAAEQTIAAGLAEELHDRVLELRGLMAAMRSPVQPLHGDAHLRNVLAGPDGPLWNDWEDTTLGPLHWDAACLLAPSAVSGARDGSQEALRAAGLDALDPAEVSLWVDARILQGAIWCLFIGRPDDPWVVQARRRGGGYRRGADVSPM